MSLFALDIVDWAQIAGAVVAGLGLIAALATIWIAINNEQKRTQPIVIVRHLNATAAEVFASACNEGAGPAFNVRLGAEWSDSERRYETSEVKEMLDRHGTIEKVRLNIPDGLAAATKPAAYLCAYENAAGATWVTRTPVAQSMPLDIRRVRFPRLRRHPAHLA